ncbi:MAG: hypothetical protein AB1665_07305 [Candidatus Thermoplasmatota archaeon]
MPTNDNLKVSKTCTARVYRELVRQRVMGVKAVSAMCGGDRRARDVMYVLIRRGLAVRIHRGLYGAVPVEYEGKYHEVDRYVIAYRAGGEGALAYHSALELHGVAQSYFNTVFYARRRPMRGFEFQGVQYVFVTTEKLSGVVEVWREGVKVPVTDRERTFLDCLRRLDCCGGLEEYIKSVQTFHILDFKNLEAHLRRFGERSLYQRAGYVLSLLRDDFKPPEGFLGAMRRKVGRRTCYLVPRLASGAGRFVGEWNLVVPDNIEELTRFV